MCKQHAHFFFKDTCDLDLDSLAPYIPTHEEDFHLTPILDGLASDSVLNRYLPTLSETWSALDQKPTDSEEVCFHRYVFLDTFCTV